MFAWAQRQHAVEDEAPQNYALQKSNIICEFSQLTQAQSVELGKQLESDLPIEILLFILEFYEYSVQLSATTQVYQIQRQLYGKFKCDKSKQLRTVFRNVSVLCMGVAPRVACTMARNLHGIRIYGYNTCISEPDMIQLLMYNRMLHHISVPLNKQSDIGATLASLTHLKVNAELRDVQLTSMPTSHALLSSEIKAILAVPSVRRIGVDNFALDDDFFLTVFSSQQLHSVRLTMNTMGLNPTSILEAIQVVPFNFSITKLTINNMNKQALLPDSLAHFVNTKLKALKRLTIMSANTTSQNFLETVLQNTVVESLHLKILSLGTAIPALHALANNSVLQEFVLTSALTKITPESLAELVKNTSIHTLQLYVQSIAAPSIALLSTMTNLRHVVLPQHIAEDQRLEIAKQMPFLTSLHFV